MKKKMKKTCKRRFKVADLILGSVGLLVICFIFYVLCAIPVRVFAPKHYVSEEKYIYDMWQNHYYEERQHPNPAIKSTKEINRYYYKVKNGNAYYDRWTSYDISDITVIHNQEHEYIVMERLHYKHDLFDKMYETSSSQEMPEIKAHYFIHKDTARKLGINVE